MEKWNNLDKNQFIVGGMSYDKLEAGVYNFGSSMQGLTFSKVDIVTDKLIDLPDPALQQIMQRIRKFWAVEDRYRHFNLVYKTGIFMHGPPGGGKTATIQAIQKEFVSYHDGIVLLGGNLSYLSTALITIRKIEPKRPLAVILEDIDEIVENHGEHNLLSLLDGERQIDGVIYLATTNFPEKLGARIIDRPSRFDEVIEICMPSAEVRNIYLSKTTNLPAETIQKWTADSDGLSIAHLRELVIGVLCLEQPYETVIKRIRSMGALLNKPKPNEDDWASVGV